MSLCPNPSGALSINGFDLESECSTVLDPYVPLWTVGALVESEASHIGGRPGDIVFAPEIGSWEFRMTFVLVGERDFDGEAFDDPWVGLESNMNYLNDQFLFPIAGNNGLQPAVLTMPSGEERRADVLIRPVQPGKVDVGDNGTCSADAGSGISVFARYVIPMFIPSGLFVP